MTQTKEVFDLSGVRAMIGVEQEVGENAAYLAKQPIEASEIRRFALSVEDCNPIWIDNEYAKKTKWGGILAPPAFIGCSANTWIDIPGCDPPPFGGMYCGTEYEFFLPVRVGDKIKGKSAIYDVVEKTGKFAGPVVFLTAQSIYTNQNDEVVRIVRGIVAKYSTATAKERGAYKGEELGEMYPPGHPGHGRKGELRARGATPLYYEDVSIGTELPPLVRKLTIPAIVDQGGRVGIYIPHTLPGLGCWWHYIPGESWRVRGLAAPMDFGTRRDAQLGQLVTDWMGDDGWLSKLTVQIRRPIYAGDTTTWKGKVTNKYVKDNQHFVECEIKGENQREQISTTGNATAILPSRS
ncbi:MaoC family dehydratase N-terminal domain-containing protein [Chloroflexota bacterium]